MVVPKPYNGTYWLFHIPTDPTESVNLASENPDVLQDLLNEYNTIKSSKAFVADLSLTYGFNDPQSDPRLRPDKTWGPFINSSFCPYGHEFDGLGELQKSSSGHHAI